MRDSPPVRKINFDLRKLKLDWRCQAGGGSKPTNLRNLTRRAAIGFQSHENPKVHQRLAEEDERRRRKIRSKLHEAASADLRKIEAGEPFPLCRVGAVRQFADPMFVEHG